MSISFTGSINSRSGGISSAIAKEARKLSLKPVKKILFQFDPFLKESEQTRNFLFNLSRTSLCKTNPACVWKTNIICDRSDPSVSFSLDNGSTVLFKSKNLSALEMFQLYNKHITSLIPKDEPVTIAKTKAEKAAQKKR